MKKRVFSRGFTLSMLIYILIAATAICWMMINLFRFLERYEETLPRRAVENYISSLDEDYISRLAEDYCEVGKYRLLKPERLVESAARLARNGLRCETEYKGAEQINVHVFSGEQELGYAELTRTGEESYKLRSWEKAAEHYDFGFLLHSFKVSVPDGYGISVDGVVLGDEYISSSGEPFKSTKELGIIECLPTITTYTVGEYIGEPEIIEIAPDGSVSDAGVFNEEDYLDNCSEEQLAAMEEFLTNFTKAYIRFAGNANGRRDGNLSDVRKFAEPGSEFDELLLISQETVYWETGRSNELTKLVINHCLELGDGKYYVDMMYICNTLGTKGYVATVNSVKMIVTESEGQLLVSNMVSY